MAEISEAHKKQSRRTAAAAVAVVAVLSLAFIGLVEFLDGTARQAKEGKVSLEEVSSTEPFYTLLIGSDSRKGTALYTGKKTDHAQVDQHADVMTLMRVDPATYTITLVSIPRDTVLRGTSWKVNDSLLDGDPEETVATAERLTGVEIDYYMMTTFTSFEALVNALGGVTVDVPKDVKVPDPMTADNVELQAGSAQELDGSEALVLARARKEYGEHQEALRQINVRNIETAMIQKVLSLDSEKSANAVLLDLEEYTTTNLDMASIGYLVVDFVAHREEVTIYSTTGPYVGGENAEGLWVVEEDPLAWAELMAVVDAGEDPEGIVKLPNHS
ncbi:LCP family protein [Eggerthella timonensis]|uniref:LCP family protein n=1 Tax=Eggerthella timonensis TaxID=1871008 RepID=UPI000C777708|nr:LCP family protein [Eggerthella timonensis]